MFTCLQREKKHYEKYYDVQVELLGFQNLQNSTILIEKEIVFTIVGVLLYHAIPSSELEILYNEAKSLETNANDCKWEDQ
jgi:hypothetical protein